MKIVNMHQAKTHLSRLVEAVQAGEEVVIARSGQPVARLVAAGPLKGPRRPGGLKGRIRIGDDFDAPLPTDLARAFGPAAADDADADGAGGAGS